ncbi:uncharacterized protein NECHADRAFT_76655 [Fusarium vanettenii 77-13-4]|uniref:Uncharacterized protein n=1 Tax=Fusarium vanettenii (strain ATCC MYA-4622 / CBS 123669 / FGSC 9596 / NRRL 45880 / 77-13-4) TaxID=660122 RepID=C7Z4W0_FUSV7|nr:uncharacterized protein NECHADRAFT_76655 [Fusarium vanettenii 77-13-4]EEU40992.1 predicted protein [Fusarium vanettenii 77-13-4]
MSHTNASSRLAQSSREGLQPSSPDPSQTAAAPEFGQLIRLLEDKLAQGSDADISLSMDDTHELVRALRFSKDANDRLQVVEQELVEAKQRAGESPFLGKFGDYARHVWNDIHSASDDGELPKKVTDAATLIEDPTGKKGTIFRKRAETLRQPLSEQAARCAAFAYSVRCQLFHSEEVYNATKETIGPRADADLETLATDLPNSRSDQLGYWQEIINYVKCTRGPQGSKSGKTSSDKVSIPRLSGLTSIQSAQLLAILAADGTLPRSATPFLLEHGVFGASPVVPLVSRSNRGQSAPPLAIRKRKEIAGEDVPLYEPFAKRQELGLPPGEKANDNDMKASERQNIDTAHMLL